MTKVTGGAAAWRIRRIGIAIFAAAALHQSTWAASVNVLIGYEDLVARLGQGNVPNGAGVIVAQVEGGPPDNYGPDQANPDFIGKSFTAMSGPPGISGHATGVGGFMYGHSVSIAPGITSIFLYAAGSWTQSGHLGAGSGAAPLATPGGIKILNNSWVGTFQNQTFDNEVLRRADFIVPRDSLLIVNGVNNSSPSQPLMSHMFNGIAVGISAATHVYGDTLASYDGPGRMKPEILAPTGFTSFAAPIIDATAALLVQTARTAPLLMNNPNAQRTETLKATILAGGNHRAGWSNNPATSGPARGVTAKPLDPILGVDTVNVNNSHLILTGIEQEGAATPPTAPSIQYRGWDLASMNPASSKYYRFRVNAVADKISILATWHRTVRPDFTSYSLADFNLILWRAGPSGQLFSLIGDGGVPFFAAGNVVSQSAIDNLEHLYIMNLQPADYVIELKRIDAVPGPQDVALAWLLPNLPRPGDVTGDGVVNVDDLLAVIGAWGGCPVPCPPTCAADVTGNCTVNVDDLLVVIANWG